jgi:3-oxoacyl-[acyl-carrier protein] reductase
MAFADLTGKVALVTGAGAARGIGFAAARALAAQGALVALTATSDRVHERAAELGTHAATADLTDADAAAALVRGVEAEVGPVDVLVNNAGMAQSGGPDLGRSFTDLDPPTWAAALDRNLTTAVNVTRAVLPGMLERGSGRVVMVSSVTGPLVSMPGDAAYSAAKAGLDGLMRALALEAAPRGVTVNSVAPGWIDTPSATDDERRAGRHTPVGRPGTPDEVAAAILFLAAPESSYVTGSVLVVDGGNTIQEAKGAERP